MAGAMSDHHNQLRQISIPVMYKDCEWRTLPGTERHPPMTIPITEIVTLERVDDGSRLVKLTMPKGRGWVMLPADLFAENIVGKIVGDGR